MKKTRIDKIGNIKLDSPFIAAPMAGVTDSAYRGILRGMGAALTCTEMVSAKGLLYGNRKTGDLLRISPEEDLVSFQIFGSDPYVMARAADQMSDMGNAFLDINMGCPVPKVVKNGEGSALLKDLQLLKEVTEAVVNNAGKPVTVKMRIGWDSNSIVAKEAAQAAESAGAAAICVHGRTRDQFYEGKADRRVIAEVKKAVKIPVIGNGDIFSADDAIEMMEETGCDFVLIARGMLGNPWIFRECLALWNNGAWDGKGARQAVLAGPTREEKVEVMLHHFDKLAELKSEKIAVREMRKHFGWYTKGIPGAAEKRRLVNNINDPDDLRKMIREI
jgi:tRNA-dihydrouridine synthase B